MFGIRTDNRATFSDYNSCRLGNTKLLFVVSSQSASLAGWAPWVGLTAWAVAF